MIDDVDRICAYRSSLPDTRDFVEDRHRVGWAGEEAFSKRFALPMDRAWVPGTGADFELDLRLDDGRVNTYSVDVKCYRKAYNVLVPVGEIKHDLYVLSQYHDDAPAQLLGWCWATTVRCAPSKRFGYEIVNHFVPRRDLRDMRELDERHVRV